MEQELGTVTAYGDIFHVLYQKRHFPVPAVVVGHAQVFGLCLFRKELVSARGEMYADVPFRMLLEYLADNRRIVVHCTVGLYQDRLLSA